VALFVLTAPARAVEPAGEGTEEQVLIEDLKSQNDPTILTSYVWGEAEWSNNRHDGHSLEVTLGGRKGWHISHRQDWAMQLEIPHLSQSTGDADDHGLGDIRVTVGTAFHLNKSWRAAAGLELAMPTAGDSLGGDVWRLREIAAVAWDAAPWLTFSPQAKYSHSIAREHGAAPVRYLELYLPATILLPNRWSTTARYEAKLDFENNFVTHSGKLSVGKQFDHPKIGLGLSLKVPFNSPSNEYQLNFSVSNYF
jgi:hypothetical protein